MAKGGQGKGKAKGHSKQSYSPSSSNNIAYPSSIKRIVRTSAPRVSYGRGVDWRYSKEGKLINNQKGLNISKLPRRRLNMTAYCMKCRKKVEMVSPKQVTMKNGRPATTGTCSYCGTKLFRIGK